MDCEIRQYLAAVYITKGESSRMIDQMISVTGTFIWYYYICKREVWLISRQLSPDERDENVEWGRFCTSVNKVDT